MSSRVYDPRREALRGTVSRVVAALASLPNPAARKRAADYALGFWLSAAEDDPTVCPAFRADIMEWFEATAQLNNATKLAKLLAIAQIELRGFERVDDEG